MNPIDGAISQFTDELMDVCTTPPLGNPKHYKMHEMGYLLPYHAYVGLVCKVAQDHRLTANQTKSMKELLLQPKGE